MTDTTALAPRVPPGRYDTARGPLPRPLRIALSGLGIVAVVVVGYYLFLRPTAALTGSTTGFQVVGDTSVHISFEVHAPAGRTVYCTVRGRDVHEQDVGHAVVRVVVGDSGQQQASDDVPTSSRAITGELVGCSYSTDGGGTDDG